MLLTTKGRYAVMAMTEISLSSSGKPLTLSAIAAKQAIDLRYLEQIFSKLRHANLVRSVKGPGGGYVLNKNLKDINIAEIIHAVGENTKMTRCNGVSGCMPTGAKCLTHDLWAALDKNITNFLSSISLADVIHKEFEL
jgi:Rrf2 family iron-sulfur cluster assembly transcriptional regulator